VLHIERIGRLIGVSIVEKLRDWLSPISLALMNQPAFDCCQIGTQPFVAKKKVWDVSFEYNSVLNHQQVSNPKRRSSLSVLAD